MIRLREQLALYVTEQYPFGPVDSARIDLEHDLAWRYLFDGQNRIHEGFAKRPQVIVGRRGSGKTALLQSAAIDSTIDLRVSLNTAQTFEAVIERVEGSSKTWLVESVCDLWDVLLRSAILLELIKQHPGDPQLDAVRDFVGKMGIEQSANIESGLWAILNAVAEKMASSTAGMVASVVKQIVGAPFALAREQAARFMQGRNLRAIVLVDSLDGYDLTAHDFRKSLAGLLRCAGQFSPARDHCDIRFCLPAELYSEIATAVSAAPVKDFSNRLLIRWEPFELLSIAAHRIKAYLLAFNPGALTHAERLDPDVAADAEALFSLVFPPEVTNRFGHTERTLTYLLRHTQLLPRHVLLFLNAIGRRHLRRHTGSPYQTTSDRVSPNAVVQGVEQEEHTLVAEVFAGYRPRYPWLRDACDRLLPNVPTMFNASTLHKAFIRFARGTTGMTDDFFGFQRALIEAGILGMHTASKARYEEAEFEYTVPEQLKASAEQVYCLHPLFSRIYRATYGDTAAPRCVYPRGTSWFEYR